MRIIFTLQCFQQLQLSYSQKLIWSSYSVTSKYGWNDQISLLTDHTWVFSITKQEKISSYPAAIGKQKLSTASITKQEKEQASKNASVSGNI